MATRILLRIRKASEFPRLSEAFPLDCHSSRRWSSSEAQRPALFQGQDQATKQSPLRTRLPRPSGSQ